MMNLHYNFSYTAVSKARVMPLNMWMTFPRPFAHYLGCIALHALPTHHQGQRDFFYIVCHFKQWQKIPTQRSRLHVSKTHVNESTAISNKNTPHCQSAGVQRTLFMRAFSWRPASLAGRKVECACKSDNSGSWGHFQHLLRKTSGHHHNDHDTGSLSQHRATARMETDPHSITVGRQEGQGHRIFWNTNN